MKILSIILSSSHTCYLERAIDSILNQQSHDLDIDILVNVNTLDLNYYKQASKLVNEKYPSVQIVQTQSNGRPGMGHNSCIELFRSKQNYTHMFLLDGDDALFPCAYRQYQKLLVSRPDLDIAHLILNDNITCQEKPNQHLPLIGNFRVYTSKEAQENWWQKITIENPFELPLNQCRTPSRILIASRRILETTIPIEYSINCKLYDDFKAFLSFSKAQFSGELNTVALSDPNLYCYNGTNEGSVTLNFIQEDHINDQEAFDTECKNGMFDTIGENWESCLRQLPYQYISPPEEFSFQERITFCADFAKFEILDCIRHAEEFQKQGQFKKASRNYQLALDYGAASLALFLNLGLTLLKSGSYSKSIHAFNSALTIEPNNYDCNYHLAVLYNTIEDYTSSKYYSEECLAVKSSDPRMSSVFQKAELELARRGIEFELVTKPKNDKPVLCIYTGYSDTFNGMNYCHKNVYGSEHAAIHMAEQFTADYKVFVFCPCKPEEEIVYNGVSYMNLNSFESFQKQVHINVMIVSRFIHFFWVFKNTADKTIFWCHDARAHEHFQGRVFNKVGIHFMNNLWNQFDAIICMTEWHSKIFKQINNISPKDYSKIKVIGNAIIQEEFDTTLEKNPNRFIWCSDTSRGLDILLDMFPRIQEILPFASLDIYFGSISEHQRETIEKLSNVKFHGRIPQKDLNRELCKTTYWLYPTTSHETFCINSLAAMTAGCIVITRDYSGLANVTRGFGKLIPGDPRTIEWQDQSIQFITAVSNNPELKKQIQEHSKKASVSWGDRYVKLWKPLLESI